MFGAVSSKKRYLPTAPLHTSLSERPAAGRLFPVIYNFLSPHEYVEPDKQQHTFQNTRNRNTPPDPVQRKCCMNQYQRKRNPETPDTFHSDRGTFWRHQGKRELPAF